MVKAPGTVGECQLRKFGGNSYLTPTHIQWSIVLEEALSGDVSLLRYDLLVTCERIEGRPLYVKKRKIDNLNLMPKPK